MLKKAINYLFGKGIQDARWVNASQKDSIGNISVTAAETIEKNLTPRQLYELSIAVNAAVSAISRNISKAKWCIYTRDGREVVGGDLWRLLNRPAKGVSSQKFLGEIASWFNIAGEFCINAAKPVGGIPTELQLLNPYRLAIVNPLRANTVADILQWRYMWLNGATELIRGDHLIFERTFNPNDSIRGLSPLITGAMEAGGNHEASRYRKQYFENSAIPSHILTIPEGTSRAQREELRDLYTQEFSTHHGNAHKVFVVAGKDAKVQPLSPTITDGPFMEMSRWSVGQIAMLYHVPAIEMGIYDKSRFDTAAEERKLFVESTLSPQMELISQTIQIQLVDRFFAMSEVVTEKAHMTKSMSDHFEESIATNDDSNLLVLLDPDSLPIMSAVKSAQVALAKEMREVVMTSPKKICEFMHIDIEDDRPERDEIFMLNNYVCVSNPELNQKLNTQNGAGNQPKDSSPKKPGPKEEKKALDGFDKHLRALRKLALSALDDGRLFSLEDADALSDEKAFQHGNRVMRHELARAIRDADDPHRKAKDFFNRFDPKRSGEWI